LDTKIKTIEVKNLNGINYPTKPLPLTFFISSPYLENDHIKLRRLSVTGLITALFLNFLTVNRCRFMRLLKFVGFLDNPEFCQYSFKYWRFDFWNVLKRRKNEIEERKYQELQRNKVDLEMKKCFDKFRATVNFGLRDSAVN
jgi:hypothetical protein